MLRGRSRQPLLLRSAVVLLYSYSLLETASCQDELPKKKKPQLSAQVEVEVVQPDEQVGPQAAGGNAGTIDGCLCATFSSPVCAEGVTYSNSCWAICAGVPAGSWAGGACGKKPSASDVFIAAGPCGHVSECSHIGDVVNVYASGGLVCGWCQLGDGNEDGLGLPCATGPTSDCLPAGDCSGLWAGSLGACTTEGPTEQPVATLPPAASMLELFGTPGPASSTLLGAQAGDLPTPTTLPLGTPDTPPAPSPTPGASSNLMQPVPTSTGLPEILHSTPEACSHCITELGSPAYGADGVTYGSRCQAECTGAAVATPAPCSITAPAPSWSAASHWQLACVAYCTMWQQSSAVCGTDSLMYPNVCTATCFGVEVVSSERCQ